jgi:MoaA/NifB/PqqE/SkfB family radical SAM enzyme
MALPMNFELKILPFLQNCEHILITAEGEPFLDPQLQATVAYANNNVHITTNGTLFHTVELKHFENVKSMIVSIDAPSKDLYEKTRGGNLDNVLYNLKLLKKELPNVNLILSMLITKYSIMYLDEFYKICKEYKASTMLLQKCRFWKELKKYEIDDTDLYVLNNFYNEVRDIPMTFNNFSSTELDFIRNERRNSVYTYVYEIPKNIEVNKIEIPKTNPYIDFLAKIPKQKYNKTLPNRHINDLIKEYYAELKDKEIKEPWCYAPWTRFNIDPKGNVRPCCSTLQYFNDLSEIDKELNINTCTDIFSAWNSLEYQHLRRAMFGKERLPDECKNCNDCYRHQFRDEYLKFRGL